MTAMEGGNAETQEQFFGGTHFSAGTFSLLASPSEN